MPCHACSPLHPRSSYRTLPFVEIFYCAKGENRLYINQDQYYSSSVLLVDLGLDEPDERWPRVALRVTQVDDQREVSAVRLLEATGSKVEREELY
jgi:hypothetical protein